MSRCPFGFGRRSDALHNKLDESQLPIWTLHKLRDEGIHGRCVLALKGVVFDVRQENGDAPEYLQPFLGNDISRLLLWTSTDFADPAQGRPQTKFDERLLNRGVSDSAYDQIHTLETLSVRFASQYHPVAVLEERHLLFTTAGPLDIGRGAHAEASPQIKAAADKLHDIVGSADLVELRAYMDQLESERPQELIPILNCPAGPMRSAAVFKACENQNREQIEMLIHRGASLESKSPLYDNDTPWELAQRLRLPSDVVNLLRPSEAGPWSSARNPRS